MGAFSSVSRSARRISGNDVMFLLSVAFVVFAFVLTIVVIRP